MDAMDKIRAAVQKETPESGARQIGECVLMVAAADPRAAELIAADLDNKEMGLDKCFAALKEHARKNQKGGFWGCMCNSFDKGNAVIQVICRFYHIPAEWFDGDPQKPEPVRAPAAAVDLLDLL